MSMNVYAPNAVSEYQTFVDYVNDAPQGVGSTESTILWRDLNAHIRIATKTLKYVIGWHGDPAFN